MTKGYTSVVINRSGITTRTSSGTQGMIPTPATTTATMIALIVAIIIIAPLTDLRVLHAGFHPTTETNLHVDPLMDQVVADEAAMEVEAGVEAEVEAGEDRRVVAGGVRLLKMIIADGTAASPCPHARPPETAHQVCTKQPNTTGV